MKKLCQCKLPLLLALVLALPLYGCSASSGGERAASTASAPQLNGLTSDQVQFYQVQTSLWESESPRRCVLTSADAFADFSAATPTWRRTGVSGGRGHAGPVLL